MKHFMALEVFPFSLHPALKTVVMDQFRVKVWKKLLPSHT